MTTTKKAVTQDKAGAEQKTTPAILKNAQSQRSSEQRKPIKQVAKSELAKLIEQERESLKEDEQQQLGAFTQCNVKRDLDIKLYNSEANCKPLTLTFCDLRADSKASLSLRDDQQAILHAGNNQERLAGLRLSTSTDSVLNLRNFLVNARELYLQTYDECSEITLYLTILTKQSSIKGRVDLPPGASITLQSMCDRSALIGLSSFAIDLD